jgi:hypothetical protein
LREGTSEVKIDFMHLVSDSNEARPAGGPSVTRNVSPFPVKDRASAGLDILLQACAVMVTEMRPLLSIKKMNVSPTTQLTVLIAN